MTKITPQIEFSEEPLTEALIDLAMPLLEAHWREIAHYQDIELAVDRKAYLDAADAGHVRVYLFQEAGTLQGYAVFFLRQNIHYSGSLQAVQDILYIDPKYRHQMLGARFILWCDEQLAKDGVQVVMHHVKIAHDFGPTLERLRYEKVEYIYSRRLDE